MRRAWTTFAAVSITNLQMSMALSMVFVVFPDLEDSFAESSKATLSWAVNIFTIVGAATLVLGAALSRRWGDKQTLLAGTALFTTASVAAGAAPTVAVLLACRIVQALGSSLIIPSGAALVFHDFPITRRSIAVSSSAAIGALGAAAGPSLGGVIIQAGGWRWAFLLNLPLGVAAFAVVRKYVRHTEPAPELPLPDAVSSVLLSLGVGSIVLALIEAPDWGWLDPFTVGFVALGLALLAVVARRAFVHPRPLLDLVLLKDARFCFGSSALIVFSVGFFGFLLTSVLFLTDVWDYSIRRAGVLTTPIFATTALMSFVSARLAARVGARAVLAAGALLWVSGTVWLALSVTPAPATSRWLPAVITLGLGSGLLWGSLMTASMATLPTSAMAGGMSLSQTLQNIGNAFGVAVMITVVGPLSVGSLGNFPAAWIASAVITTAAMVLSFAAVPSRSGRSAAAVTLAESETAPAR